MTTFNVKKEERVSEETQVGFLNKGDVFYHPDEDSIFVFMEVLCPEDKDYTDLLDLARAFDLANKRVTLFETYDKVTIVDSVTITYKL